MQWLDEGPMMTNYGALNLVTISGTFVEFNKQPNIKQLKSDHTLAKDKKDMVKEA